MAQEFLQLGQDTINAAVQDTEIITKDELKDVAEAKAIAENVVEQGKPKVDSLSDQKISEKAHELQAESNTNNDEDEMLVTEGDDNASVFTSNSPIMTEQEEEEEEDNDGESQLSKVSGFLATCGINLVLPFLNGMMLGFGELLAHELGFRYGWIGAKVYPQQRMDLRNLQMASSAARQQATRNTSKYL